MITLAILAEDECLILQAQTLELAIRNQSRRIESEPWDIEGLKVQAVIEHKTVRRSGPVWVRSWLLDGHRIGHNALMGAFRKARAG